MSIFALVNPDHTPFSWTRSMDDVAPDYAARGFSLVTLPDTPDPAQGAVWDVATQAFVAGPPAPVWFEPDDFLALFTPAEWAAATASADPNVHFLVARLTLRRVPIDLRSPTIVGGVNYLETAQVIATGRAAVILAGTAP